MAYAINAATYTTTIFSDSLSGTPDNWTDGGGGGHSYASSELTFTDNSGASSEYTTNSPGSQSARKLYFRTTWRYTSGSSTPALLHLDDGSFNHSVGMYVDFDVGGLLYARDGAGNTSTGITVGSATNREIEFVIDRDAGTYQIYVAGSLTGTYTITTNNDANFSRITIGGGTTGAQEVYVFSDTILYKHTIAAASASFVPQLLTLGVG